MDKLVTVTGLKLDVKHAGRCLDELMQQRGVTQADVIAATGLGRNVPSKYLNGLVTEPSLNAVVRLYATFGLTPNRAAADFMGWTSREGELKSREWEEVEGIILTLSDRPEMKRRLLEHLVATARVYLSMNEKETA